MRILLAMSLFLAVRVSCAFGATLDTTSTGGLAGVWLGVTESTRALDIDFTGPYYVTAAEFSLTNELGTLVEQAGANAVALDLDDVYVGSLSAGVLGMASVLDYDPTDGILSPNPYISVYASANASWEFNEPPIRPVALYVQELNAVPLWDWDIGIDSSAADTSLSVEFDPNGTYLRTVLTVGNRLTIIPGVLAVALVPIQASAINGGTEIHCELPSLTQGNVAGIQAFSTVSVWDLGTGDFNADGTTDLADVDFFSKLGADPTQSGILSLEDGIEMMDQNDDSKLDATDTEVLVETWGGLIYCDLNGDGYVDGAEYSVWADNFGSSGVYTEGDFSGNGFVDGADYSLWADHYNPPPPAMANAAAVPEPSAAILAVAAMAVFGLVRVVGSRRSLQSSVNVTCGAARRFASDRSL